MPANSYNYDPNQILEATKMNWQNLDQSGPMIQSQQTAFQQTFKNLMGRDPTSDEVNQYFGQSFANAAHPDLLDPYQTAQSYTTNAFGPDITKYQQQQQTDQLTKSQGLVQDLVNQTMSNTAGQFKDPNSQLYQQFSGGMNNMGITPSSGAFQAGAGSTIANSGLQAANNALQGVTIPGVNSIQGLTSTPYQSAYSGAAAGQQNSQNLQDFFLQAQLAQMLGNQGGQSGWMKDLGMASGAAQGTGSLLQGGAQAYKATWICTAMRNENILGPLEVKRLHNHLYPAFWKRPWKFLGYLALGKFVVLAANLLKIDWNDWRSRFYDQVIWEEDPVKAVDLYELSFWELVKEIRHRIRVKMLLVYHPGIHP
jgi:hypothetical protein